ncbi:hypothetical protein HAX54_042379 [Datura stramonium]|uniref:Uncharacterized protein n=1 Tax=Datura stramonium TaxID=4076 RepID=A0ABS8W162_DATST|nr:hypothetical protein [Datura stramonium]
MQVQSQGYRPLPQTRISLALHGSRSVTHQCGTDIGCLCPAFFLIKVTHRCFTDHHPRFAGVTSFNISSLLFGYHPVFQFLSINSTLAVVMLSNLCMVLTLSYNIMSISRQNSSGKALMTNINTQDLTSEEAQRILELRFRLDKMESYYLSFKGNRFITAEPQFEVESFKDDVLNIYNQIGIRDWGPLTIPVGPYFPKLVWEFYASYKVRQSNLKHKGRVDTMPCLPSVRVRGQEVNITIQSN